MRSWVFRNRARLEALYGARRRRRAALATPDGTAAALPSGASGLRLRTVQLVPLPRSTPSAR